MRAFLLVLAGIVSVGAASRVATGDARPHAAGDAAELKPAFLLAHEGADMGAGGSGQDQAGETQAQPPHFVRWIGHFHPAMTVFPIGMLLGAALAELFLLITGAGWLSGASRWCVIVGAMGAAITAPLGWAFAAGHGESSLLETHRWLGTSAGAGALVILFLSEMRHRKGSNGWRTLFRTVLFLAVPLVMATGYFGGAMVYGVHAYEWNPPGGQSANGADGATTRPSEAGVTTVTMTDDDMFKPATVTIAAGTTVRWVNSSKDEHTVTNDARVANTAGDVSIPSGAKAFNSGKIKPGGTFEQKFTIPGTYKYVCEPHQEMNMKGTIVVKQTP